MKYTGAISSLYLCLSIALASSEDGQDNGAALQNLLGKRSRAFEGYSSDDTPEKRSTGQENPLYVEHDAFLHGLTANYETRFCGQVKKVVDGTFPLEVLASEIGFEADLNQVCEDGGSTALHLAAPKGLIDLATTLLLAGASVDPRDENGRTPLHCAVIAGKTEMIDLLLRSESDATAKDFGQYSPLDYAILESVDTVTVFVRLVPSSVRSLLENETDPGRVQTLLQAGVALNERNDNGETVLHVLARREDSCPIIELLVESGARTNVFDNQGQTPLYHALKNEGSKAMECFLALGPLLDIRDARGHTPLLAVVQDYMEGHLEDESAINHLELLAVHNAPLVHLLELDDLTRQAILHISAVGNCVSIAKFLLEAGTAFDETFVEAAIGHLDLTILMKAFEEESDRNYSLYCHALLTAIEVGDSEALEFLLRKSPKETLEKCALVPAVVTRLLFEESLDPLKLILHHGANINVGDADTKTTGLLRAVNFADIVLVNFLLKNGADPNKCNAFGDLPLGSAARNAKYSVMEHLEIMRSLFEHGANLDAKGPNGNTALMSALEHESSSEAVWALLQAGADPNIANDRGESPAGKYEDRIRNISSKFSRKSAKFIS